MGFLLRSAQDSDWPDLLRLGRLLGTVHLSQNREALRRSLAVSRESFAGCYREKKSRATFLFVLEDLDSKRVIGASKILARHGDLKNPHVYLQAREETASYSPLNLKIRHRYYRLGQDSRGMSEVGALILDPAYRGHPEKLGKQLSWVRFCYMKIHPKWFLSRVIAELLPNFSSPGCSNFYEQWVRPWLRLPYGQADRLSAEKKSFLLKLFPKGKIYEDWFSSEIKRDFAHSGPVSQAAEHLLLKNGFRFTGQVDPLDGGPYLISPRHRIHAFRQTRFLTFGVSVFSKSQKLKRYLVLREKDGQVSAAVIFGKNHGGRFLMDLDTVSSFPAFKEAGGWVCPWSS